MTQDDVDRIADEFGITGVRYIVHPTFRQISAIAQGHYLGMSMEHTELFDFPSAEVGCLYFSAFDKYSSLRRLMAAIKASGDAFAGLANKLERAHIGAGI